MSKFEDPNDLGLRQGDRIRHYLVKRVVPSLIEDGKFQHPWIGFSGNTVTKEIAEAMDLKQVAGALVVQVISGSPADDDDDNEYEVQVTVTDSGLLTDVQDLVVTVTDMSDGALDPSFGGDGLVTTPVGSAHDHAQALASQLHRLPRLHQALLRGGVSGGGPANLQGDLLLQKVPGQLPLPVPFLRLRHAGAVQRHRLGLVAAAGAAVQPLEHAGRDAAAGGQDLFRQADGSLFFKDAAIQQ